MGGGSGLEFGPMMVVWRERKKEGRKEGRSDEMRDERDKRIDGSVG